MEQNNFPLIISKMINYSVEPGFLFSSLRCYAPPITGNFDSDPSTKEIAFVVNVGNVSYSGDLVSSKVYIVSSRGDVLKIIDLPFPILKEIASSDIDGDEKQELFLISTWALETKNAIYSLDSNGKIIWEHVSDTSDEQYNNFILTKLNNGDVGIAIVTDLIRSGTYFSTNLKIFSAKNGAPICTSKDKLSSYTKLVSFDLEGNEKFDILASTFGGIKVFDNNCNLVKIFRHYSRAYDLNILNSGDGTELLFSQGDLLYNILINEINGLESPWPQFQHDAQHTGCYDCDTLKKPVPAPTLPQSKLSNLGTTVISGKLNIMVQQYNPATNSWITRLDKTVISYPVTVKANGGIVKLDGIFNPRKISLLEAGKYRVVATFVSNRGTKVESSWEFGVV